jgi:hypothetical protein
MPGTSASFILKIFKFLELKLFDSERKLNLRLTGFEAKEGETENELVQRLPQSKPLKPKPSFKSLIYPLQPNLNVKNLKPFIFNLKLNT